MIPKWKVLSGGLLTATQFASALNSIDTDHPGYHYVTSHYLGIIGWDVVLYNPDGV